MHTANIRNCTTTTTPTSLSLSLSLVEHHYILLPSNLDQIQRDKSHLTDIFSAFQFLHVTVQAAEFVIKTKQKTLLHSRVKGADVPNDEDPDIKAVECTSNRQLQ